LKHLKKFKNKFNPKASKKTYGWMPNPHFKIKKVSESNIDENLTLEDIIEASNPDATKEMLDLIHE